MTRLGEDGSLLREHRVKGRPRWQWDTSNIGRVPVDQATEFNHVVKLEGPEDVVVWEIWHGSHCLEVVKPRRKGEQEARDYVVWLRDTGQAKRRANAAWERENPRLGKT